MMTFPAASDMKISKTRSKLLQTAGLTLCMAMLFSTVSCSKNNVDDGKIVSVDTPYFSSSLLDFSEAADGEYASTRCVKQLRDSLGILISGTSKYYIQLYDNSGQLFSQTTLEDSMGLESTLVDIAGDLDGNLYILTQSYDEINEKVVSELFTFDSKGALIGKPLVLPVEELVSQSQIEVDNAGNIYLYFSSAMTGSRGISVFDSSGTQMYDISENNGKSIGNLLQIEDQMYTVCYDSANDTLKIGLYPLDNTGEKLGEPIDISDTLRSGGGSLSIGKDGLYSYNTKGVYSVDLDNQKSSSLFLWENTNFKKAAFDTDQVIVLSTDTTIVFKEGNSGNSINSVSLLTREKVNPDAGKKIITIAGSMISMDSTVLSAVYDFNMSNEEYRIEIHDYWGDPKFSTITSSYSLVSAMNLEILSGDGPDIIYGDNELFANCENKGIFVDLYTMMANDSEFNKDAVIPSIMKICETDGHLYKLGPGFLLNGFIGAKSIIGDRTGWTFDEFNNFAESLPDEMLPLLGFTQTELLSRSLCANMNSFVDSKSGTVSFDSDDFRKLLDYAKLYGTDDDNTNTIRPDSSEMIANGELAMSSTAICSAETYAYEVMKFGGPVSITGYPSTEKSTAACYMPTMIAISSRSDNKEAAWDFFKYFFNEKGQLAVSSRDEIPVVVSAFEAQVETQLNSDQNAGGVIYCDQWGNPIPISSDMADDYRDLIYGLTSLGSYDTDILSIVLEEVPPYFNDQKSQDDVIALIQNRVQTLVDERQ